MGGIDRKFPSALSPLKGFFGTRILSFMKKTNKSMLETVDHPLDDTEREERLRTGALFLELCRKMQGSTAKDLPHTEDMPPTPAASGTTVQDIMDKVNRHEAQALIDIGSFFLNVG